MCLHPEPWDAETLTNVRDSEVAKYIHLEDPPETSTFKTLCGTSHLDDPETKHLLLRLACPKFWLLTAQLLCSNTNWTTAPLRTEFGCSSAGACWTQMQPHLCLWWSALLPFYIQFCNALRIASNSRSFMWRVWCNCDQQPLAISFWED